MRRRMCLCQRDTFLCARYLMNLSVLYVVGHGHGAKRGLDAVNSYHLEQLKMLLKGDQITFIDGETEREGVVVRIDRFNQLLDIEVGQQI